MMDVGINLFKQTDNLTESEPRMTSDWDGFKRNQSFEVPLHDNDQQYRTISTGLVQIQPDRFGQGFIDFITPSYVEGFPPMSLPGNASYVAISNTQCQCRPLFVQMGAQNRDLSYALHSSHRHVLGASANARLKSTIRS